MTARQKWLLTAAVCLSTVFLAAVNSSHGPLLSPMIARYALTDSQQGYPNAAQNIGCIAAMFTSLWVIGRVRKQTLLTLAVGVMALLMLPLSLLPPFPVYLGLYALVGVAYAYMDAIASSMIADLHTGKNSARMMCVMHACHGLSGIVSPLLLGAALGAGGDMPRAYWTVLAIGIVTLAFLWPVNARVPLSDAAARPEPLSRRQLGAFFGDSTLRALAIAILFYGVHLSGMIVWIDRYVDVGLQSSLGALALAFLYAGLTGSRLIVPLLRVRPDDLYLPFLPDRGGAAGRRPVRGQCGGDVRVRAGLFAGQRRAGARHPRHGLRRVRLQHAAGLDADESEHAGGELRFFAVDRMIEARAGMGWGMSVCAIALIAAAVAPALCLRAQRRAA